MQQIYHTLTSKYLKHTYKLHTCQCKWPQAEWHEFLSHLTLLERVNPYVIGEPDNLWDYPLQTICCRFPDKIGNI